MSKDEDKVMIDNIREEKEELTRIMNNDRKVNRQIHLISGMEQVLVTSEDGNDEIDFLLDRALIAMLECKKNRNGHSVDDIQ